MFSHIVCQVGPFSFKMRSALHPSSEVDLETGSHGGLRLFWRLVVEPCLTITPCCFLSGPITRPLFSFTNIFYGGSVWFSERRATEEKKNEVEMKINADAICAYVM